MLPGGAIIPFEYPSSVIRYRVGKFQRTLYIGRYQRHVENSVTLDPSLEYGATFRFPVTWSYLTGTTNNPAQPLPTTSQKSKPAPIRNLGVVDLPPVEAPVETRVEPPPAAIPSVALVPAPKPTQPQNPPVPRASGAEARWEMVIPKMARPAALNTAARAQRSLPQRAPQSVERPAETPTDISFYAGSEASFLPRRWKALSISAVVVVVGCVVAWVRPGSDSRVSSETSPAAAGTWSRRTAYVMGSNDPREILVYSGTDGLKNYRIEFAWVPDPRGVGLIFRATDSANYFAAKLRLLQAGAIPTLTAEHFAVVKGVEGAHSRKVITLSRTNSEVLVRLEATGPAFTLYLQGSPAEYWTDERFESGSLGFYEERGERPRLQALRFTLFKKSGLQTVVTSLQ